MPCPASAQIPFEMRCYKRLTAIKGCYNLLGETGVNNYTRPL